MVWPGYWNLNLKGTAALPELLPSFWFAQSLPHDCSDQTSDTVAAWSMAPCIHGSAGPVTPT